MRKRHMIEKAGNPHMTEAQQNRETDTVPPAEETSVGEYIRRTRHEKKMSLKELAAASGVSIGMLSQVERDIANPSMRVLQNIRRALNIPLPALFAASNALKTDPEFVRRSGARPILDLGHLRKELISSGSAHNLQIMILHIDPGTSSGGVLLSYPAVKGGMVLSGEFILTVGEEETLLKKGDSFVFDSAIPHSFRNNSKETAQVLWIIGAVQLDRHL